MRTARSHLYIPGDSERKIRSAAELQSDSYILDLEDGVAPSRKQAALNSLPKTLAELNKQDVWVRINSAAMGLADLEVIAALEGVSGIWIPKAEPGEIFQSQLSLAKKSNLQVGILLESAVGYLGRHELLAPEHVTRVQIGEYDLRGDLGMAENLASTEPDLNPFRLEVVIAAVANQIESIVAGVSANFTDLELYEASSHRMRNLGFNGRAVIHPAQVDICQRVFSPSEKEIAAAKKIVSDFAEKASEGVGAYRDEDGNMTDAATIRRAQRILEQLS